MTRVLAFAIAVVSCAVAAPARADVYEFPPQPLDVELAGLHSPQHFALEIKFGPYSPDIDSTPGLHGHPFSDLFLSQDDPQAGTGARPPGRLLTTIEFDWQFWHRFGSLGLAASAGFMRRTTHAFQFNRDAAGNMLACQVPNCIRSADETALNVMPLTLELVYRFDVLTRYKIPLVPYLKGGIGYYFWWIENGSGGLASGLHNSNDSAIGGTFGLVAHPGIALLLDILDPGAAQTMDSELGINHVYLFGELNYAWITGLGEANKMVLSDLTWNVGVAFEF